MRQGIFFILVMISGLACGQSPNSPPSSEELVVHVLDNSQGLVKRDLDYLKQNELREELKAHCGDGNYVVGPMVNTDALFLTDSKVLQARVIRFAIAACFRTGEFRPLISIGDLEEAYQEINGTIQGENYPSHQAFEANLKRIAAQSLSGNAISPEVVYVALHSAISYELKSSHADR